MGTAPMIVGARSKLCLRRSSTGKKEAKMYRIRIVKASIVASVLCIINTFVCAAESSPNSTYMFRTVQFALRQSRIHVREYAHETVKVMAIF